MFGGDIISNCSERALGTFRLLSEPLGSSRYRSVFNRLPVAVETGQLVLLAHSLVWHRDLLCVVVVVPFA